MRGVVALDWLQIEGACIKSDILARGFGALLTHQMEYVPAMWILGVYWYNFHDDSVLKYERPWNDIDG